MAWKIILGIILFFVLIFSVRVKVWVHSEDGVELKVGWLFLKFTILPKKEKKPKKKKKEKKKKEEPSEPDETVKEPKEKEGDNMFVRFYHNNGVDGVVELLHGLTSSLGGMFRRIGRAFVFNELYINLLVGGGDSNETALKYGKTSAAVYPAMGYMVSNMKVKKYGAEVHANFIDGTSKAMVHTMISVRPIKLTNAFVIVGVQLVNRVLIKFLKGLKVKKTEAEKE